MTLTHFRPIIINIIGTCGAVGALVISSMELDAVACVRVRA